MSVPGNIAALVAAAAKMPPDRARRTLSAIAAQAAGADSLDDFARVSAAAFEKDMQPVCAALAGALHANDLEALKGFQALIPGLLREINRAPALADLLALQLGTAFLAGITKPEALA